MDDISSNTMWELSRWVETSLVHIRERYNNSHMITNERESSGGNETCGEETV